MNSSSTSTSLKAALKKELMPIEVMWSVFFTSTQTALWSESFWPLTTGQYAGVCIFLIAFAAVFRGLLAIRSNFATIVERWTYRQETDILRRKPGSGREDKGGSWVKEQSIDRAHRPWRINVAILRALLDTILAGVSYLLMLAEMTMNIGYFMSILGGVFLGSFVLGGYADFHDDHSH